MKPINAILDHLRTVVRAYMRSVAHLLNRLTGGRLSPNTVTIVGLLMHIPIAALIALGYNWWAAPLLVIFGLFDTLDGELARLQKRDSAAGMVLDASTDRLKEVFLYSGVAYALIHSAHPSTALWAVAACGLSLSVSYVKAKGETAVAGSNLSVSQVNRLFQEGLLRFEVRMGLLVIGLLIHQLVIITIMIAVLSGYTAIDRLNRIMRALDVQN